MDNVSKDALLNSESNSEFTILSKISADSERSLKQPCRRFEPVSLPSSSNCMDEPVPALYLFLLLFFIKRFSQPIYTCWLAFLKTKLRFQLNDKVIRIFTLMSPKAFTCSAIAIPIYQLQKTRNFTIISVFISPNSSRLNSARTLFRPEKSEKRNLNVILYSLGQFGNFLFSFIIGQLSLQG